MKNIILYWMRWTWKSTIWKNLSHKMKYEFFDLDKSIEDFVWEQLNTYIDKNWWEKFREIENKVLVEILNLKIDKIISLWWWTITFENNRDLLLKKSTKLIYIDSSLENITNRILLDEKNWNNRNSLTGKSISDELESIYNSRKSIYEYCNDFKVLNNNSIESCISEILLKVNYWNICVPIIDFEKDNLTKQIENINNSREIKFVELRIDFMNDYEFQNCYEILKTIKKQVIITNRSSLEWWKFELWFDYSVNKLIKFIDIWDYFDIELKAWKNIDKLKDVLNKYDKKLIISYHDFEKTSSFDESKSILFQMKTYNPEVYKIAMMPNTKKDLELIYQLNNFFQSNFLADCIFISMWEIWIQTRIEVPKKWWLLTFWILNQASAPWQIHFVDLYNRIFL